MKKIVISALTLLYILSAGSVFAFEGGMGDGSDSNGGVGDSSIGDGGLGDGSTSNGGTSSDD